MGGMTYPTATDLQKSISHWLATPVNGYLGSGYGSDAPAMLQNPQRAGLADSFLTKLQSDVPLAGALPRNALNMYAVDRGPDRKEIYIEASGALVSVGNTR